MIADRLPYPGLRAFTREESDLFFGREGCVDAMVDRFAATRFLAVLGPSGSGKSSLVRTGFQDALELGLHPWAGSRWKIADMHPGSQPMHNLALALLRARDSQEPDEIDVQLLTEYLEFGPRSVLEWAAGGNVEPGTNLLLMVDQFEELFRYGDYAQRETAEAFVALLLESAAAPGAAVHIVITMRSEFLGACALISGLAERINVGLYLTPRMGREECREAIEGPASVLGFKVERALVNRLLNDLGSFAPWETGEIAEQAEKLSRQADQLPVMQHVLNRLYVRALNSPAGTKNVELKLADYERIGGLSGALDAHGAEVIDWLEKRLGKECLPRIETVFRSLVSGTSIALAVRRPSRLKELVELTGADLEMVITIVEAFRAPGCNFLRTSQQFLRYDDVIVDISHESLIRQWSALRGWLVTEWRDRAAWERLVAAEEHYRQGEGDLLKGLDLQNLSAWWESAKPSAIWASRHGGHYDLAKAFLEKSQETEAAQAQTELQRVASERTRLRVYVAGLAVALLISTVFGLRAHQATNAARQAEARANTSAHEALANSRQAKAMADLAHAATSLAKDNELKALASAELAKASADQAVENARKSASFLENLSDVLYADASRDLVGTRGLRSQLMAQFLAYQTDLQKRNAGAFGPEERIRNDYRQALSFQSAGEARAALNSYRDAYEDGLKTIRTHSEGPHTDEALMATFLQDASYYAWYLFDVGETDEATAVLGNIRDVLKKHAVSQQTSALLLAQGVVENLEARYAEDTHQQQASEMHSRKALALGERALAAPGSGLAAKAFTAKAAKNLITMTKEPETSRLVTQMCSLADKMHEEGPTNQSSIRARVTCLTWQGSQAYYRKDMNTAMSKLQEASREANVALAVDANDPELLLMDADIENSLADYSAGIAQAKNRDSLEESDLSAYLKEHPHAISETTYRHRVAAKERFVRAMTDRTPLQESTTQLRNIFENCIRATFPNEEEELKFYRQIFSAMEPTLNTFPKAPGFAYIAGRASERMGALLSKDKAHWKEAEKDFSQSVSWFDRSGLIHNLDNYSEDFDQYCTVFKERAEFFGKTGRLDAMRAGFAKMRADCTPALEKYPWAFFLRMQLVEADALEGHALLEAHQYAEAMAFLERASYWGRTDSTHLLAGMYRQGLGTKIDTQKADALDKLSVSQKMTTITISVHFGPIVESVDFYARQWPVEFVRQFPGITDQVKWYRDARRAVIDQQQVDALTKLQEIALRHHDSYPALCLIQDYLEPAEARYQAYVKAGNKLEADRVMQELVEVANPLTVAMPGMASTYYAWMIYKFQGDQMLSTNRALARQAYVKSVGLAAQFPDNKAIFFVPYIQSSFALGGMDLEEKKIEDASAQFSKSTGAAKKAFALDPSVETERRLRITSETLIGTLETLKKDSEAEQARTALIASVTDLLKNVSTDEARLEGGRIYREVASDEVRIGNRVAAMKELVRARELSSAVSLNTAEGSFGRYVAFNGMGDAFLEAGSASDAREAYRQSASAIEHYLTFRMGKPEARSQSDTTELYNLYGSLSYIDVEAGRFPEAIRAAEAGLALKPDASWIEANMAHGYLFSGKRAEAIAHYMHARAGKLGDRTITQATEDDFKQLRKLGITDSHTDAILAQMRQP